VTGRRRRRRKQLVDTRKERRGYWKLKEETLDHTVWRTGFGKTMDLSQDRLENVINERMIEITLTKYR